ncbi:MAG TPA: 3-hydroxyacyl-CoA dehydrogenase family protein [Syntrophales bacterium]|nr:3-hydroxyacyl-CoA dehydrogenase family protein [Syntrophales bacterium]
MMLHDIKHVGILGAGLMGHGIAQVFASAGYKVNLYDVDDATLKAAKDRIASNFKVFIALNLAKPGDVRDCLDRITLSPSVKGLCEGPQFIIEAIVEDLKVKRNSFAEIERFASPEAILSSNTSAISITEISGALARKGRFLGTHFWNPPQVLPCVEVIKGACTDETIFETVYTLMEKVGKVPVRVLKDVPGFIGNRLQHAMWREAISLCDKGVASAEDIDKVVKYGFGARMPFIGPMETADLAGLVLTRDIHRYLFPYLESATKPAAVLEGLISEGATGVKTGRGFYEWTPEKIQQIIQQRDTVLLRILHEIIGAVKHG